MTDDALNSSRADDAGQRLALPAAQRALEQRLSEYASTAGISGKQRLGAGAGPKLGPPPRMLAPAPQWAQPDTKVYKARLGAPRSMATLDGRSSTPGEYAFAGGPPVSPPSGTTSSVSHRAVSEAPTAAARFA
jgi:hypothetical protein